MHPRRIADYKPINIRIDAHTESYLESIRLPFESNSALINRIIAEHHEYKIAERWSKQ